MVHMCESCELTWIIMSPYLLVIANCVARSVTFWPTPVQTCPNQIGSNPSGVVHRLFLHSLIFSEFPQELSSHLTWKETPSLMVTFLKNCPWNMVTARGYVNHAIGPTSTAPCQRCSFSCSPTIFRKATKISASRTLRVDGRNPVNSPVEVGCLAHYLQGFCTSHVVQDSFHQQYDWVSVNYCYSHITSSSRESKID